MPSHPEDVSRFVVTPRPKVATRAEEVLRWWVERQAGVVARWQLIKAGVSDAQVALSHRSAAAAWGLRPSSRRRVDVTTARAGGRGHVAIDAHQSRLDPKDVTALDGLPVTTVARTALDLAEVAPQRHVERYLVAAEQQRVFDLTAFLDVLHRHPGRHGQKPLRAALAAHLPEAERSKSEMELVALDLIRAHGLPLPQINVLVEGFEVDLYWPAQRVAIELDSRRYHLNSVAFEDDHERRTELIARGYTATGFTWDQLVGRPGWVASQLGALLRTPASAIAA